MLMALSGAVWELSGSCLGAVWELSGRIGRMKCYDCEYKGEPAAAIDTGLYTAVFLPGHGAKLASFVDNGTGLEAMSQAGGAAYRPLAYDGEYTRSECGGFDDMFPTIDPCTLKEGRFKGLELNDHGEVCRLPHSCGADGGGLRFNCRSRRFDFTFSKTATCGADKRLRVSYKIQNNSGEFFPSLYAAHLMLAGCEGGRLSFGRRGDGKAPPQGRRNAGGQAAPPGFTDAFAETVFASEGTGFRAGEAAPLSPSHLSLAPYAPGGGTFKYYLTKPAGFDSFSYSYPESNISFVFEYDGGKLPYFGAWLNSGGFQDRYNIAPEPCTAPFDSPENAEKRGVRSGLEPGGTLEFDLCLYFISKQKSKA